MLHLSKTIAKTLNKNYNNPVGYRKWKDIVSICNSYCEIINNYFWKFDNDPLAKNMAILIIHAAYNQIPVYWVSRDTYQKLSEIPVTDQAVRDFNPTIKDAIFIFPQGLFIDTYGDSVDWLIYKALTPTNPVDPIKYLNTTYGVHSFKQDRLLWGSIVSNTGAAYFTQIDPKNYSYSINLVVDKSAGITAQDSKVITNVSNLLINCLIYADTLQELEDKPLGFHSKHSPKNNPLIAPRWLKPLLIRPKLLHKGGSHKSPIEHTRREHIRRYRDSEGNIVRTVKVKQTVVNKVK